MVLLGVPEKPVPMGAFPLTAGRRSLAGSMIGGIGETQEMLDFCAKHNTPSEIEMIPIQKANEAYSRILKSDVRLSLRDRYGFAQNELIGGFARCTMRRSPCIGNSQNCSLSAAGSSKLPYIRTIESGKAP
jgi:hypothetical protein